MTRPTQLFLIAFLVAAITSVISHLLVGCLGIRTGTVTHRVVGDGDVKPLAYAAGSSLMSDALGLDRISAELRLGLETWFVAGGSPSEWETYQSRAAQASLTLFAISAYDLNEDFLCDFRSQVVPIGRTVNDLMQSGCTWSFAKRVLSQYPLKYVRLLFPTAGRSQGVMGGLKEQLRKGLRPWIAMKSDLGPVVPASVGAGLDPAKEERISDWTAGYRLQRLAKLRSACQGQHSFDGPKKLALTRMLQQARWQGRVIVVVLPVSSAYEHEFISPEVARKFEKALAEAQRAVPEAHWVRLDHIPQLDSNDHFWDVVHMNQFGQRIATDALILRLRELAPQS